MSSLEVSIATRASGPVLVLAGEADVTSITRLDEASPPRYRAGGAADNRRSEPALRRFGVDETLVMAAMKARTRAGSVTLLDPQPPVARMLDLLRIDEMFSIRHRAADETHPDTSAADGRPGGRTTRSFG